MGIQIAASQTLAQLSAKTAFGRIDHGFSRTVLIRNHLLRAGLIPLLVPAATIYAASVTGTVGDETGKPINKARVSIHLRAGSNMLVHPSSAAAKGRTPTWKAFNGSTQSDSRGGFAFANVPAGVIQVCVQTDSRLQFDPCLWDRNANYFEFHATQDVNLPAVRVETGYLLSVTVSAASLDFRAKK